MLYNVTINAQHESGAGNVAFAYDEATVMFRDDDTIHVKGRGTDSDEGTFPLWAVNFITMHPCG